MTDEREQALHYAARLRGLSLVRSGDRYALVHYVLTDASLDDIAAFLVADDGGAEPGAAQGDRRTDLRAMLKAERALLGEIEQEKRKAGERGREQRDHRGGPGGNPSPHRRAPERDGPQGPALTRGGRLGTTKVELSRS